jgi:hypothetical protein
LGQPHRFDIQWHLHTGEWFCLHRGLTLAEAIDTLKSNGLLHPVWTPQVGYPAVPAGWIRVEPQTYLTDVLTKLVNLWPASRLGELMPWAWAAECGRSLAA